MQARSKGRYRVRLAKGRADLHAAQHLRYMAFVADGPGAPENAPPQAREQDEFDQHCQHVLIEQVSTGQLVGCFRVMLLVCGREIEQTYSAKYYDLTGLHGFDGAMAEMGRFCLRPGLRDPDIVRLAWGAMAQIVQDNRVGMLFGCSSFGGTRASDYGDTFRMLGEDHRAPDHWSPRIKSGEVIRFDGVAGGTNDRLRALRRTPGLLRSYLAMGGWVSDHAVVDRDLNRLHVFTGLEIAAIPVARARLLRGLAA